MSKPYEKCGKRLELLQSQPRLLRAPRSQSGPEHLNHGAPLFASFLTLQVTSWCGGRGAQVLSLEVQGGSSVPSTTGKGGISFQGSWLITLTTYSSLQPEENQIPTGPSPLQLSTPSQLTCWVTNRDVECSRPTALKTADCRVGAKASLGLRKGRRQKPALLISELN